MCFGMSKKKINLASRKEGYDSDAWKCPFYRLLKQNRAIIKKVDDDDDGEKQSFCKEEQSILANLFK